MAETTEEKKVDTTDSKRVHTYPLIRVCLLFNFILNLASA